MRGRIEMKFPKLHFQAFFKSLKSTSFTPLRLSAGFLAFFAFYQNMNHRKSQSPYFCSEIHLQTHQDLQHHHQEPKGHLDFQTYLSEKKMKKFNEPPQPNRSFAAFYHDGLRKMINCFEKYEIYVNEKIIKKFLNREPLLPHEKDEFGVICLLFKTNEITQAHKNISHGGLMATVLDHFMGRLSEMVGDGSNVATANINIFYKKPVNVGKEYLLEVHFEKLEKDKKIFLKGRILNEKNEVCVEASSLFLKVNWENHIKD